MTTQFAFDLRLARRRSGLTQSDCAHLLGMQQSRVSELENGASPPTAAELCGLAILLNRQFDGYFAAELEALKPALELRLKSLPKLKRASVANFNRHLTLRRLRKLAGDNLEDDDAA